MATVKEQTTLRLQTTKAGDLEEITLAAGETVTILKTWARFYLIRDAQGHCHNVAKDRIEP